MELWCFQIVLWHIALASASKSKYVIERAIPFVKICSKLSNLFDEIYKMLALLNLMVSVLQKCDNVFILTSKFVQRLLLGEKSYVRGFCNSVF